MYAIEPDADRGNRKVSSSPMNASAASSATSLIEAPVDRGANQYTATPPMAAASVTPMTYEFVLARISE